MKQRHWIRMPKPQYISTALAARALGVGVSTVKRWVDEGILPAHKTPGGHRKLLVADVLRLGRSGDFPRLDLGRLAAGPPRPRSAEPGDASRRLVGALRAGDGEAVHAIIREAIRSGLPLHRVADDVLAPAMHQLGHDWETGKIDVLHEHRGTLL